jgi:DNA-binding NarL/FixJ family response regulator
MTGQVGLATATMKILLVDDHILFREGLASLLGTQADMEVVGWANSGQDAIEQARALRPDAILMDLGLPDETGLETTEAILAERPETKVIFLTIQDDDERLFAAIRAGARGYLPKDVSVARLLTYVRGVVQGDPAITPAKTGRIWDRFVQTEAHKADHHAAVTSLTERERQVLQELATGASNQEIADRLVISCQTVKNHVSHILAKLELRSRHDAADIARSA